MSTLYIGWDVGGWNCDRNRVSRDGVCAVTGDLQNLALSGTPWRGAIRSRMLNAKGPEFLLDLVGLNKAFKRYVVAIDTPLGWPLAFQGLFDADDQIPAIPDDPGQNPFVFRGSERYLNSQGIATLSPVRDQIGSQATKGQAFLRFFEFARAPAQPGVWRNGAWTALEAYPAPCYHSPLEGAYAERLRRDDRFLVATRTGTWPNVAADLADAVMCAVVAAVFDQDREQLRSPAQDQFDLAVSEGWIWIPRDIDVEGLRLARRGLGEDNL